jgi:hypothetical protein
VGAAIARRLCLALLALLAAACEPAKAPLAGGVVPATATPTSAPAAALRYALGQSLTAISVDTGAIGQIALIDQLTTEDAEGYDIVVSLRQQEGWQTTDEPYVLALVLNTAMPPLNDAAVREAVVAGLDPAVIGSTTGGTVRVTAAQAASAVRQSLAAAGRPDGYALVMAHAFELGAAGVVESLSARNLEVQTIRARADQLQELIAPPRAHLLLVGGRENGTLAAWRERVGADNVIALAEVPVYYRLAEGAAVNGLTDDGLPLIGR